MFLFGGFLPAQATPPATAAPVEIWAAQAAALHLPAASPQQDARTAAKGDAPPQPSKRAPESEPSASTPVVSYKNGQLSIAADNARLSDIMSAMHDLMGAEINLPAQSSNERIWAHLGPGPPRKILSDLLGNTELDYVIQGSSTDVDGIQSILLTARSEASPERAGVANEVAAAISNRGQLPSAPADAPSSEREDSSTQQAGATVVAPPAAAAGAEASPVATAQSSSPAPGQVSNPPPPSSMTPDQIAQQLTNMYQQRKQMQQNSNGSALN